ncbi:MAG: VanZ family protein [Clostridia bacterium]|nr:VanZ family protein [Clostridia bacterium]
MTQHTKRLLFPRLLLGLLILANMGAIFFFSSQSGTDSAKTSGTVTEIFVQVTVPNFDSRPQKEQESLLKSFHPHLRDLAHAVEFGSLGALVFLFVMTFGGSALFPYCTALVFTLFYACLDELHQLLPTGRGPNLADVLIDLSGALVTCTLLLLLLLLLRRKGKAYFAVPLTVTHYSLPLLKTLPVQRIAVLSDLHRAKADGVIALLREEKPDLILIPGDLIGSKRLQDPTAEGYVLLKAAADLAPTFYSLGNHEISCAKSHLPFSHPRPVPLSDEVRTRIRACGATLLENESVLHKGMRLCGLSSGIHGRKSSPDKEALASFEQAEEVRILLCHHPEYFAPYVSSTGIELTVCGHAHGGHWRFLGRGLYAPGQGLFPKYTGGVHEGKCVISRGLGDHTGIPRIANPPEIVILEPTKD